MEILKLFWLSNKLFLFTIYSKSNKEQLPVFEMLEHKHESLQSFGRSFYIMKVHITHHR